MKNFQDWAKFGLRDADVDFIRSSFALSPWVRKVRIFGSRAKGNFTNRSDIDLAYEGDISHDQLSQIWSHLQYDAPFLYTCDIVNYNAVDSKLQEHIDRVGKEIFHS